ncbi:MAG: hypothetical protein NXI22_02060 [bacterium]|nr:hypothetical protein [bacterium]
MLPIPFEKRCFYGDPEGVTPHAELLRGEWRPDAPLKINWSMGRPSPEEIARGRSVAWFYLSPSIQELFSEHGLTGWSTYPIELADKSGDICMGYAGLSITGRCGPIQRERASPAPEENRKPGTPDLVGMYFDESTWDGSDFFCPAGTNAYKFVTDEVRQLFAQHRIKGFQFTSLNKAMWYP